jgi:DNA-binding response OmpR family regulator
MAAQARILVVDDDPRTVMTIERALRRQSYEVTVASDGREGLRKARRERPDLVILDATVPRMSGYEVCYRLKIDPDTAHIPVLMLTVEGRNDKDTRYEMYQLAKRLEKRLQGFEIGTVDFLAKPIKATDLVRQVGASIRRASERPIIEFRD